MFAFDPRLRRAQSSRSGRGGGAIERINKGKKAIYDLFRLILFEMLHGGGIFKNGLEEEEVNSIKQQMHRRGEEGRTG